MQPWPHLPLSSGLAQVVKLVEYYIQTDNATATAGLARQELVPYLPEGSMAAVQQEWGYIQVGAGAGAGMEFMECSHCWGRCLPSGAHGVLPAAARWRAMNGGGVGVGMGGGHASVLWQACARAPARPLAWRPAWQPIAGFCVPT